MDIIPEDKRRTMKPESNELMIEILLEKIRLMEAEYAGRIEALNEALKAERNEALKAERNDLI